VIPANDSFSVAAWISLDSLTGSRTVISQSGNVRHRFLIEYDAGSSRLRAVMIGGDLPNAPTAEVRSLATPAVETWTHVGVVYDAKANKLRFYVDGEPQGEGVSVLGPLWPGAGTTRIGCSALNGGTPANFLGGIVDDVRIWSSTVNPDLFGTFAHS
jgi:hypothetical protein